MHVWSMLARARPLARLVPAFRRMASSFTLPESSPAVTVRLPATLSQEQLLSFRPFTEWADRLQQSLSRQRSDAGHVFHPAPYTLRAIEVQAVDFFGGGRVGFVKLKAEVSNDDGEKLPGSVFLRGGSVGMLVSAHSAGARPVLSDR